MNISDILTSTLYSNGVATIAMIVSLVAVPASGYLSYKYAIKGEKRKEFNAVSDPLRVKLREQTALIEQGIYPASGKDKIDSKEFDALLDVSEKKDFKLLSRLVENYQFTLSESSARSESGDWSFTNPERIQESIQALLPYVERK